MRIAVLLCVCSVACGSSEDDAGVASNGGSAGSASGGTSSGGTGFGGSGFGGSGFGGSVFDAGGDAAVDAASDVGAAGAGAGCSVLFEQAGLVHESTLAEPKKTIPLPDAGPASYRRIELEVDVFHAGWTPKQGQYEVFTLRRGTKWVGNAIGYVAVVGPTSRQTVMVANLGLPGAAAPDGRRIAKSYAYTTPEDYHFEYVYDVDADLRQVTVSVDGGQVTQVTGNVSVPLASPPITSIDVANAGLYLLLGGAELTEGPDAHTLGWKFSNAKITGCQ